MIIGLNNREDDLVVNPLKGKKLTNMRAAGKDENVVLTPPIRFTLEQAMEFIDDDELIEITPTSVRLRKRNLKATDRKRSERETADQGI
jgi:GTP-binding protein